MKISIRDVSFRYHRRTPRPALEDVSVDMESGQFWALIGPNGSGKSSLSKLLLGIQRPNGGRIEIDDVDSTRIGRRERARLVSYVPQSGDLPFSLSVYDAALLGRAPYFGLRPRADDHRAVTRALTRLGLWDLRQRSLDQISGGQAQRVAIARALAQGTPAMILDEPTSALDLRYQVETMQIVRDYADEGRIALMAVHDLNLAARFCTHVLVLESGRVRRQGVPEEVFHDALIGDVYGLPVDVDRAHGYVEVRPRLADRTGAPELAYL